MTTFSIFSEFALFEENDDDYDDDFDEMDSDGEFVNGQSHVDIRRRKSSYEKPFKRRDDGRYICECGKTYKEERYLRHHLKWECNKLPSFRCPFCPYEAKRRSSMKSHLSRRHNCKDENLIVANALK